MTAVLLRQPRGEQREITRLITSRVDWGGEQDLYNGTTGTMVLFLLPCISCSSEVKV